MITDLKMRARMLSGIFGLTNMRLKSSQLARAEAIRRRSSAPLRGTFAPKMSWRSAGLSSRLRRMTVWALRTARLWIRLW